jgi:hypothetical protein
MNAQGKHTLQLCGDANLVIRCGCWLDGRPATHTGHGRAANSPGTSVLNNVMTSRPRVLETSLPLCFASDVQLDVHELVMVVFDNCPVLLHSPLHRSQPAYQPKRQSGGRWWLELLHDNTGRVAYAAAVADGAEECGLLDSPLSEMSADGCHGQT